MPTPRRVRLRLPPGPRQIHVKRPTRGELIKIAEKAETIRIGPAQPAAVVQPDRVGSPHGFCCVVQPVAGRGSHFLVRNSDIGTGQTRVGKIPVEVLGCFRRNIDPAIFSGDAMLLQPVSMHQRRAGMCDRMTCDGRFFTDPLMFRSPSGCAALPEEAKGAGQEW